MRLYVGQNFSYSHPHVQSWLFDTKIAYPELAPVNSAITLSPIAGADGKDNQVVAVESLVDLINEFGEYSAKVGYPYLCLYDHISANGRAKVINIKPDNATYAHKIISVNMVKSTMELKIDADGILWMPRPENADNPDLKTITMPVYNTSIEFDSFSGTGATPISSKGRLELAASTLLDLKTTDDGAGVAKLKAPLYAIHSTGRGGYGNKYNLNVKPARGDIKGYPLYNATVSKSGENITSPAQVVAPDDVRDSIAFSFNDVLRGTYIDVVTFEDNHTLVNDMFITAITDMVDYCEANKATTPALGKLADRLRAIKDKYIMNADDLFVHTMDWLAVCSTSDERRLFSGYITPGYEGRTLLGLHNEFDFLFPIQRISGSTLDIPLEGGYDGDLASSSKFDWNYAIFKDVDGDGQIDLSNSSVDKVYVYKKLFGDFFDGLITEDIYDTHLCDADLVEDLDYPDVIKGKVINFVDALKPIGSRGDLTFLMNAPTSISTVADLRTYHLVRNPQVNEVFKFCNSVEIINPFTEKKMKAPATYVVRRIVAKWFKEGWGMDSIAGRDLEGIADTSTIVPKIKDGDEKSDVYGVLGYNYISLDENNMPFLDGQRSSYTAMYSVLGELHNKLIHNRMWKTVVNKVQKDIHTIDTPEKAQAVADSLRETLESLYKTRLVIKDVVLAPRNAREAAIGDLTLQVFVEYAGTIKRIQVNFYTGPLGTF